MGRIGAVSGSSTPMPETARSVAQPTDDMTAQPVKQVIDRYPQAGRQQAPGVKQIDPEELKGSLEKVNKSLKNIDEHLKFSVHEATKVILVKLINTQTNEVIKEIPPEKFLDLVAKLQELVGLMVDHKV